MVLVLGRLGTRLQSRPSADYDGRAMTTILVTGGGSGLGRATAEKRAAMAVDPLVEPAAGQSFDEVRPIDSSLELRDTGKARQTWELAARSTGFEPLTHPGARA